MVVGRCSRHKHPAFTPPLCSPLTPQLGLSVLQGSRSQLPSLMVPLYPDVASCLCLLNCCSPLFHVCTNPYLVFWVFSTHQAARGRPQRTLHKPNLHDDGPMPMSTSTNDVTSRVSLPATADGWERDGLELLIVCQSQAVLHRLFQKLLTLVCTPDRTVTVDHKLGGQAVARADSRWKGRDRNSECRPSAGHTAPDARRRPLRGAAPQLVVLGETLGRDLPSESWHDDASPPGI